MNPFRRAALLTLVLAASLAAAPAPTTSTGKPLARRVEEAGILRFAEIRPGLARGGEPGERGLRYLHEQRYRTLISFLTDTAESALVVQAGMRYVHIPMRSAFYFADTPTEDQVRLFLSVVNDSTQYPVYIHCHAGKDRTGAMTAIYRMETCGWTRDEAVEEMKSFGFSGRYRKLMRYVQGYTPRRPALPAPADAAATAAAPPAATKAPAGTVPAQATAAPVSASP